jgi:hypothetical protein
MRAAVWGRLVVQRSNDSTCITSGYSVFVRGLPIDATEGEVRRHFSDVFQVRPCAHTLWCAVCFPVSLFASLCACVCLCVLVCFCACVLVCLCACVLVCLCACVLVCLCACELVSARLYVGPEARVRPPCPRMCSRRVAVLIAQYEYDGVVRD